jgi:hypothetical protein
MEIQALNHLGQSSAPVATLGSLKTPSIFQAELPLRSTLSTPGLSLTGEPGLLSALFGSLIEVLEQYTPLGSSQTIRKLQVSDAWQPRDAWAELTAVRSLDELQSTVLRKALLRALRDPEQPYAASDSSYSLLSSEPRAIGVSFQEGITRTLDSLAVDSLRAASGEASQAALSQKHVELPLQSNLPSSPQNQSSSATQTPRQAAGHAKPRPYDEQKQSKAKNRNTANEGRSLARTLLERSKKAIKVILFGE